MAEELSEIIKSNLNLLNIKLEIENYSLVAQSKESINSPVFKSVKSGNNWQLNTEMKKKKVEDKDLNKFLGIFLVLHSSRNDQVSTKFTIQILYSDGRVFKEFKNEYHIFTQKSPTWGWPKFIEFKEILEESGPLGDEDVLHIRCSIQEVYEIKQTTSDSVIDMKDEFRDMYSNQAFCDVSLAVRDQTVMAHKVILAAASPVFKTMLGSDMIEKKENKVIIEDTSFDALKALVDIIYGKPFDESILEEVLIAADKYDLMSIKEDCITKLISRLNDDNAVDCVVLGDKHDAKRLKLKAAKYITDRQ